MQQMYTALDLALHRDAVWCCSVDSILLINSWDSVQIIAKAKVPIIKFEDVESGINFDISFDAANGPEAADYVKDLMQKLPPMRPLVLILKVFLHQRELNEVNPLQS